jgi:hypothetical protein
LDEALPEPGPGAKKPLVDRVLLNTDHGGDLGIGKAIPGGESQQLAIGISEGVECLMKETNLEIGRLRSYVEGSFASESIRQANTAPPPSVLISHHPICDPEQPGPCGLAYRNLLEPAPSDREYLGSGVLAIGFPKAP